jgi:formyl-CoA transferase
VFTCKDGHINIAASGNQMYRKLCDVLKAPELVTDERFATDAARHANRDALLAEINVRAVKVAAADLIKALNDAGVPAGAIYKMNEVFADPQVQHLKMAHPVTSKKLGEIELIGQAINMSRTPFEMRAAAPEQGEHTDDVLKEAGYDAAAIASFRQRGII